MKDFIVLTKQVNAKSNSTGFSYEHYSMSYLLQETFKENVAMLQRFKDYEIDKSSIKLEVIQGVLFLVCIAYNIR